MLRETLNTDGPRVLTLIVAAVLVIVSTIALARGEAATIAAGAGRDVVVADKAPSNKLAATRAAGVFIPRLSTVAWKSWCLGRIDSR